MHSPPPTSPSQSRGKTIAYAITAAITVFFAMLLRRFPLEHGIGLVRIFGLFVLVLFVFLVCMSISFLYANPGRPGEKTLPHALAFGFLASFLLGLLAIGVTMS